MKLIIDIDKELVKEEHWFTNEELWAVVDAARNGTPIPKECGNIYAEKDIREQIENPYQCQTVLYGLELVKPIIKGDSK